VVEVAGFTAAAVRALQQAARLRCRDQLRARLGVEQARDRPVARGPAGQLDLPWVTCRHPAHGLAEALDRAAAPALATLPTDRAAERVRAPARGPAEAHDRVMDLPVAVEHDLARAVPAEVARQLAISETSSTWADPAAAPARVDDQAAALWRAAR
jgi:hypothetical protein